MAAKSSQLHDFDLRLCDYVRQNIQPHFDSPAFAKRLQNLNPVLIKFLQSDPETEAGKLPVYRLLLSHQQLDSIEMVVAGVRTRVNWLPFPSLFERVGLCTGEINRRLSPVEAKKWATRSARFIKQLKKESCPLSVGLETTIEWINCVRWNLKAMGEIKFLPPPDGPFSTPIETVSLTPEERKQLAWKDLTEVDLKRIESLRAAIQNIQPREGGHASPTVLIKEAQVARTDGYRLLHLLADSGEYIWEFRIRR